MSVRLKIQPKDLVTLLLEQNEKPTFLKGQSTFFKQYNKLAPKPMPLHLLCVTKCFYLIQQLRHQNSTRVVFKKHIKWLFQQSQQSGRLMCIL